MDLYILSLLKRISNATTQEVQTQTQSYQTSQKIAWKLDDIDWK